MTPRKKVPWFIRALFPDVVIPAVALAAVAWMVWNALEGRRP